MQITVNTMPDDQEIVRYDSPAFPLYIRPGRLFDYAGNRADCHWHEDVELIYIFDGEMNYYINGKTVSLGPGDGIAVNSKAMHYGYAARDIDCHFVCILFHPDLLAANRAVYQQYVAPLLEQSRWEYCPLRREEHADALSLIQGLWDLAQAGGAGCEVQEIGLLYAFWAALRRIILLLETAYRREQDPSVLPMKQMVSYIRRHYSEPISISDLCACAGVSKSTCFAFFRKHAMLTPVDYINQYRVQTAANLLRSSGASVTEIAGQCGFNGPSYFTKVFTRIMGCTPNAYRKEQRRPQDI